MPEPGVSSAPLLLLEWIARAIREELGESIDAYPGLRSPEEADPINRAFRTVVRSLIGSVSTPATDLDGPMSWGLRQLALRRLEAEGWDDDRVKSLIEDEPGGPDDWLVFLILSSRPQIEPLLDPDD